MRRFDNLRNKEHHSGEQIYKPVPRFAPDTTGTGIVSHEGAALLLHTAEKTGLTSALSGSLSPWRKPLATHDPAKVILDLAISLAIGGDCLADIAVLREQPSVFGHVASDPTVSRTIDTLAANPAAALSAINTARAHARANAWAAAGENAPGHDIEVDNPLVIDLDATLVTAHSEKESATPTYKKGFGFHPLLAFVDHGAAGTGEPVSALLRPGNAGANTVADPPPSTPCRAVPPERGQSCSGPIALHLRRLTNLPLRDFAQNQIWLAIVSLATELTDWTQMLALTGDR